MPLPGQTKDRERMHPESGMAVDSTDTIYDVTAWRKRVEALLGGGTPGDPLDINIIGKNSGYGVEVNEDGQLHIVAEGKSCPENSTDTPLLADGVWTGTATNILAYNAISVFCYSDVSSVDHGLEVQYSQNGVTDWHTAESYTIVGGSEKWFTPPSFGAWLRIRYTNNGVDQTEFHLETTLRKMPIKFSSHNIDDPITDQDDAELVKAVITGKKVDGNYDNVSLTNGGNMKVSLEELESQVSVNNNTQLRTTTFTSTGVEIKDALSIARGSFSDTFAVAKFGAAPDFDQTDGEVTVWDGAEDGTAWGLMRYVYSTTADIDSISSDSALDIHDIVIQGLDTDYNLVNQTVTLNGQNRVPLTTNLVRVFRAYNDNTVDLAGHVFIYKNGTLTGGVPNTNADIRAVIHPENNQTEMGIYTVPAGKTAYLTVYFASQAGASKATNYIFRLYKRDFGKVWRLQHRLAITNAPFDKEFRVPLQFSEKTDIELTCELSASGVTGATVIGGFDLIIEDN